MDENFNLQKAETHLNLADLMLYASACQKFDAGLMSVEEFDEYEKALDAWKKEGDRLRDTLNRCANYYS